MRPILPNQAELPDEDGVEAVQIIRSSSRTRATHVHLFPKQSTDESSYCIRMEEGSTYKVDSAECEDFEYAHVNLAESDGDTEPNHTYPDLDAIFENDMIECDDTIPHDFAAVEDMGSRRLHNRAIKPC